jgi:hypothetical protein
LEETNAVVLTKDELIAALRKEVRILQHLTSQIDRSQLDYRPTPKQRSTIELLRYLSVMGPGMIRAANHGFDREAWGQAMAAANARDFDATVAVLAGHGDEYAALVNGMTEADFRASMVGFDGTPTTRGAFIVDLVLGGCAAYRTQLFMYLKSCGRAELGTTDLWAGVHAQPVG